MGDLKAPGHFVLKEIRIQVPKGMTREEYDLLRDAVQETVRNNVECLRADLRTLHPRLNLRQVE